MIKGYSVYIQVGSGIYLKLQGNLIYLEVQENKDTLEIVHHRDYLSPIWTALV